MPSQVGDFLRSRRARVLPEQVGLARFDSRRRVSGLRREELAQLAGVSVDYYMRLEQGRATHVSDSVLDAVGRVLRLTTAEREHLANIARAATPTPEPSQGHGVVDVVVLRLIAMMWAVPALVLDRGMDVVACNPLADEVFAIGNQPPGRRNVARFAFLDEHVRRRVLNSDEIGAQAVAYLRLQLGRHPKDPYLLALTGDLAARSANFARIWADQEVRDGHPAVVVVDHPDVGRMTFTNLWLTLPETHDAVLVAYTVEQGSPSEERLALLRPGLAHRAGARGDADQTDLAAL